MRSKRIIAYMLILLPVLLLVFALAAVRPTVARSPSVTTAWTEITPDRRGPQPREGAAWVFDTQAHVLRLFGGYNREALNNPDNPTPYLKDMWTFANGQWTFRPIAADEVSTWPAGRSHFAYAYDSDRQVLVIYGGYISTTTHIPQGDLFEFDGDHWRFIDTRTGHGDYPGPRAAAAMAYDNTRHQVVMFGGFDQHCDGGACNLRSETFTWDGTNWMRKFPAHTPPDRAYHAMVYDSARQRIVMYGGTGYDRNGGFILLQDTWEWDGSDWQQVMGSNAAPREGHAMSYDSERGRVLLFGGDVITPSTLITAATTIVTQDTYEYDGTAWTTPDVVTDLPVSRTFAVMVYDPNQHGDVLFSGITSNTTYLNDLWLYGLAPNATRTPAPPTATPTHTSTPSPPTAIPTPTPTPQAGEGQLEAVVWRDLNHNGVLDTFEHGKAGVPVILFAPNGSSQQGTTDSQGRFVFAHLAPGHYTVTIVKPDGYTQTTPTSVILDVQANLVSVANFGLRPQAVHWLPVVLKR